MRTGSRSNPLTAALLAGHRQGAFLLPDDMLAARDRLGALQAAVAGLRAPNAERPARLSAVQALFADPSADVARGVEAARQADNEHELRASLLREATEGAHDELDRVEPDTILTEYLQPAFADCLDRLAAAFRTFSPVSTDPDQLWDAPTKVRAAWSEFRRGANQHEIIRAAWRATRVGGEQQPALDRDDLLGEIRNLDLVWPARVTGLLPVSTMVAPWPQRRNTVEWLLWCLQAGAVLWLPTAAEQDAQWSVVFGQRAREFAAGVHHNTQMRQVFTG